MPFAGNVEPSGWKFCNSQELSTGTFSQLFQLIGYNYKSSAEVSAGTFATPDLRGRFPLGSVVMGGTAVEASDTTRVNTANSQVLGAVDGSPGATIGVDNLPEHQHDLKSPGGQQFFIHREEDGRGVIPDGAQPSNLQTGAENLSQRFNTSGDVSIPAGSGFSEVGAALPITNPYQTINYIIYTGVI
jgi:microcystin-dependent protein